MNLHGLRKEAEAVNVVVFERHSSVRPGLAEQTSERIVAERVSLVDRVLYLESLKTLVVLERRDLVLGVLDRVAAGGVVVGIFGQPVHRVEILPDPAGLVVLEFLVQPRNAASTPPSKGGELALQSLRGGVFVARRGGKSIGDRVSNLFPASWSDKIGLANKTGQLQEFI